MRGRGSGSSALGGEDLQYLETIFITLLIAVPIAL